MPNPIQNLLGRIFPKPSTIPADTVKQLQAGLLSDRDKEMLSKLGVTMNTLLETMFQQTSLDLDRASFYRTVERSLLYPLIGSATEFYADTATPFSHLQNATAWPVTESGEYRTSIEALFDRIGLEEKIYDWAWSVAAYGDLFIKINAEPGIGIVSIDDSLHPLSVSRVDINGRLVGFFETPMGYGQETRKLIAPWEYVHLRILGAAKKRDLRGDTGYTGYGVITILAPDIRRVSTRFGNCLPGHARLHLEHCTLSIKDIVDCKLNVKVKTINPVTNQVEFRKVIGHSVRRNEDGLILLGCGSGYRRRTICGTKEHLILTTSGWKEFQEVEVGSQVMVKGTVLTEEQKQILFANLLGDASIGFRKLKRGITFGRYSFSQSKYLEYYEWIKRNLPIVKKEGIKKGGKIKRAFGEERDKGKYIEAGDRHFFMSHEESVFDEVVRVCYSQGKKKVTRNWLDKINALGLAIWFMDDGTPQHNCRSVIICTDGFSFEEHCIIKEWFKERWDMEVSIRKSGISKNKGRLWRIYVPVKECIKFLSIVAPYMRVDNSQKYAGRRKIWHAKDLACKAEKGLVPVVVTTKEKVEPLDKRVYDIEVEGNHNFIVGDYGFCVHNSLLTNALPIYKRLRLAEDSLMLARLSKGILRYVYKVQVSGSNMEAVTPIIESYTNVLKRARALNLDPENPNFEDKYMELACLRGGVEIPLLDGSTPFIAQMASDEEKYIGKEVWSINPKTLELEVDRIKGVKKTRKNAELVRVHLDNNDYIDCTPDHKFMLRDGTFEEAISLVAGVRLMPFYTKIIKNGLPGYQAVYDPADNRYHLTHSLVVRKVFGEVSGHLIRHHIDYNKLNNETGNIAFMTKEEHGRLHRNENCPLRGKTYEEVYGVEKAKRIKKALSGARLQRSPREIRICACGCGEQFEVLASRTTKTVSGHFVRLPTHFVPHTGRKPGFTLTQEHKDSLSRARKERFRRMTEGEKIEYRKRFANAYKIRWANKSVEEKKAFSEKRSSIQKIVWEDEGYRERRANTFALKRKKKMAEEATVILNHKVTKVEKLDTREDTYDLQTEKNHNFPVGAGIFVHNSNEDIILPVWDNVNNLQIEKLGGEADIKFIVDIQDMRGQLAVALRIPIQLLGGNLEQLPASLGQSALERLDIRFARSMRRLQRALIDALVRICQIHLAFQNKSPDPTLFDINMAETSSAEEEELKNALGTGVDVVEKLADMIIKYVPSVDTTELLNYLNNKILKLGDLDIQKMVKDVKDEVGLRTEEGHPARDVAAEMEKRAKSNGRRFLREGRNTDIFAMNYNSKSKWDSLYSECEIKVGEEADGKS